MKIFTKALMYIGFALMLLGMGSMDSASMIVPVCLLFAGLGMFAFGGHLSEVYYTDER